MPCRGGWTEEKENQLFSVYTFVILYLHLSYFLHFFLTTSHHISVSVFVCMTLSLLCFWIVFQSFNYSRKDFVWPRLGNMHTFQKHHPVHGMQTPGIEPIPLIGKWLPNMEMFASVKWSIPVYRSSLVWSGLRGVCFLLTPKYEWQSSLWICGLSLEVLTHIHPNPHVLHSRLMALLRWNSQKIELPCQFVMILS